MGLLILIFTLAIGSAECSGQTSLHVSADAPWSTRIAESFLLRHPDCTTYDTGFASTKWTYEQGLLLTALEQMWVQSGEKKYLEFMERNLRRYVGDNGTIDTYKQEDYKLDDLSGGRVLLTLYKATKDEKFGKAADILREHLRNQPRTSEGGFWHKKIYPHQMWLDGLFMAEPFYARYAVLFNDSGAFADIGRQFSLITGHTRDVKTGLFYHGWDESKKERWANRETGCSPSFWGRAMGWYAMALVDVLDELPRERSERAGLIADLKMFADAIIKYQDKTTHVWYQVVDQGDRKENYLESSASCMFAYALAKGANNGYLGRKYYEYAHEAFTGIIDHFTTIDANGFVNLSGTCRGAGLGGTPYRDGSFEYYVHEPQRTNDPKGVGPFLMAALELEKGESGHVRTGQ